MLFAITSNPTVSTQIQSPNKELQDMPNVIFLIGDGMGPEQIRAASLVEYGVENGSIMDTDFPIQYYYTTNAIDGSTTDSAASGTALATGQKTKNRIISMDQTKSIFYKTMLEYLRYDFGYATGLVSTMIISHATPAVFGSHFENRDDFDAIRSQEMVQGIDVMLGGGLTSPVFGPDAASAKSKGEAYGYDVATNVNELNSLDDTSNKLLGVFGGIDHIGYELDGGVEGAPSLYEMSDSALRVLDRQNKPYFIMIEGGLIDYAGHLDSIVENKTAYQIFETIAFEKTVRLALDYAKADGNTIVVVGADHETGGFQIFDYDNLDNTLPGPQRTAEENFNIRYTRSYELNASFKWNAHTDTPVRFFGYGSDFGGYDVQTNADVFWAINSALGRFPTVLNQTYTATADNLEVNMGIKDLDSSANQIGIIVDYANGTSIEVKSPLQFNQETIFTKSIAVDSSQAYTAYAKVYDSGTYDVLSFDNENHLTLQDVTYITPTTSSSTKTSTPTTSESSSSSTKSNSSFNPTYLIFIIPMSLVKSKIFNHKMVRH